MTNDQDILAFDVGGTRGRCCLARADGTHGDVIGLARAPHEDGARWLARLLEAGRDLNKAPGKRRVVGVSFGGPVAPDGRVLSMHVPGWEKVDLAGAMAGAFGLPVCIENDGNTGALGEHRFGAGRGTRYMAFLNSSTGIGGGVILDGKLYRGAHGLAAEFGHMVMRTGPDAPQYAAGKPGVLEALASGPAIARDGALALRGLGRPVPANFGAKHVFDAARNGEAWAVEVRDRAVEELARGVAAVICAYDPERVVIGGGVSLAGDALFEPLRAGVTRFVPHYLERKADIVPAALGDSAPLMGAVAAAGERG
ncbi:MAG: ROK family protein [Planctomycetota bacterium]|nr:ROK family protein [Planctomycetota bacterium]